VSSAQWQDTAHFRALGQRLEFLQSRRSRAIAEAIGPTLGVPVKSRLEAEAKDHFGPLALIVGVDNPVSNTTSRE
jgi:hypothetical protein